MKRYDWKKIQQEYDSGMSTTDIREKYGMSKNTIHVATKSGRLSVRNKKVAGRLYQSSKLLPVNGKKKCLDCGRNKNTTEFLEGKKYKTGYSGKCKTCKTKFYESTIKEKIKKYILNLVKNGCVDCKTTDIYTLQFDHSKGNRIYTIPQMMYTQISESKIIIELSKCEIRCASCHLKRHNVEQPSKFLLLLKEVIES